MKILKEVKLIESLVENTEGSFNLLQQLIAVAPSLSLCTVEKVITFARFNDNCDMDGVWSWIVDEIKEDIYPYVDCNN